jgi:hypothetical protein
VRTKSASPTVVVTEQATRKQTLSWLRSPALHDLPAVHGELSLSLLARHGVGDLER